MTDPDDIRSALHAAAESVAPGDPTAARESIGATARRRTRRTRAVATLGLVGAFVAAALVLVAIDDDPDTLVSTPPTELERPATTAVVSTEPLDTVAAPDSTVSLPSTGPAELVDRPLVAGAANGEDGAPDFGEWVTPWRDGFLVGSGISQARAIPTDWPDDIVALFPPEVVELFAGGVPATIDDAVRRLSEAGLLEEVSGIVRDHPEAAAYIYGEPVDEPPVADARFTVDGTTWEPVEMTLPMGVASIAAVESVGDDLVIAYRDPTSEVSAVTVATTSDLADWSVQRIELPAPVDTPPGFVRMAFVRELVANESGWLLSVLDTIRVDVAELLDWAGRPIPDSGVGDRISSTGVEVLAADGSVDAAYTWDELGVSADAVAYLLAGGGGPQAWASSWEGAPIRSETGDWTGPIVATPAGFVRWDRRTRFSADGVTWSTSPLPNDDGYVVTAFGFDGGIVAVGNSFDGVPEVFRLDETGGSVERLDVPGLPTVRQGGYTEGWAAGAGVVFDGGNQGFSVLSVQQDGYRLSVRPAVGVFELVDVATGEIVAREIAADADDERIFDFGADGVTVTDPETGQVLVTISQERLDTADATYFESSGSGPGDEQLSLVASRDGERFVVEPTVGGGFDSGNIGIATNGARALVATGAGWASFELP